MGMDGIVKKSTVSVNHQEPVIDKQPRKEQSHSYDTRGKNAQTEKKESLIQKTKNVLFKPPALRVQAADKSPSDQYQFAIGDHVIIQTAQDEAIRGIVRWTGPIKLSKKSDVPNAIAVGVETVSTCTIILVHNQREQ